MQVLIHLAKQRGISTLSFAGLNLPVNIALESDQFAPLIILSALDNFTSSGLNYAGKPFPWGVSNAGNNGFIDGNCVIEHALPLPRAVGYLFLDHQIESLVQQQLLLGHSVEHIDLGHLVDNLEARFNEPEWPQNTYTSLSH